MNVYVVVNESCEELSNPKVLGVFKYRFVAEKFAIRIANELFEKARTPLDCRDILRGNCGEIHHIHDSEYFIQIEIQEAEYHEKE